MCRNFKFETCIDLYLSFLANHRWTPSKDLNPQGSTLSLISATTNWITRTPAVAPVSWCAKKRLPFKENFVFKKDTVHWTKIHPFCWQFLNPTKFSRRTWLVSAGKFLNPPKFHLLSATTVRPLAHLHQEQQGAKTTDASKDQATKHSFLSQRFGIL